MKSNSSPFTTRGGVTPLKKGEKGEGSGKTKVRKQHAGDVGKRATATRAQDKSGYSRSGKDFVNVHSFTANTRLSPSLANTLGPSLSSAVQGKNNQSKNNTTKQQIGVDANGNPIFLPDGVEVKTRIVSGGPDAEETLKQRETGFAEACYDADGNPKASGSVHTDSLGNEYTCEWDTDYDREKIKKDIGGGNGEQKVVTEFIHNGKVIHSYEGEGEFSKEIKNKEQEE